MLAGRWGPWASRAARTAPLSASAMSQLAAVVSGGGEEAREPTTTPALASTGPPRRFGLAGRSAGAGAGMGSGAAAAVVESAAISHVTRETTSSTERVALKRSRVRGI